ncbi:MAG: hypothetical protein LBS82_04085 [Spirochaetaceae bacterium]|jgi:hypothetical protein|nr:hypothetical protein [Spirochaetaceae bacterium]
MKVKPVNRFYDDYRAGLLDKRELEAKIFRYILEHPECFGLCSYKRNKDDHTEFLCCLYPRINKSIEKFEQSAACFDTYINSIVRYADKEYRRKQVLHYETEYAICNEGAYEMMAAETEAVYGAGSDSLLEEDDKTHKPISNPRQTLILLLKAYYRVTDDFIERVAPSLGIDKQEIFRMTDALREMCSAKEKKARALRERCFSQHFRCISFEKRLHAMSKDSAYYEPLRDKLQKHHARLARMRQRLKNMRIAASNRQVAQVLGVSKGTVDASLHAIKRRAGRAKPPRVAPRALI